MFWSLAYRSTPIEDVLIVPHRRGVQGVQYGPGQSESIADSWIDATQKHADGAARAADPASIWKRARAHLGRARACRRSPPSRRGTATRSATGPACLSATRAAPPRGEWEQNGISTLRAARRRDARDARCGKGREAGLRSA